MKTNILIFALATILTSCSSGGGEPIRVHNGEIPNPLDSLITSLSDVRSFEIVLEKEHPSKEQHEYTIIAESSLIDMTGDTNYSADITQSGWLDVPTSFFNSNRKNLGMTLVSKDSTGVITRIEAPAGYSNYVGHRRYGYWSSGLWCFYPRYSMLSSRFGAISNPIYRSDYYDYNRNYRGQKSYYGTKTTTGGTKYGTSSRIRSGSRFGGGGGSFRSSGGGFGK